MSENTFADGGAAELPTSGPEATLREWQDVANSFQERLCVENGGRIEEVEGIVSDLEILSLAICGEQLQGVLVPPGSELPSCLLKNHRPLLTAPMLFAGILGTVWETSDDWQMPNITRNIHDFIAKKNTKWHDTPHIRMDVILPIVGRFEHQYVIDREQRNKIVRAIHFVRRRSLHALIALREKGFVPTAQVSQEIWDTYQQLPNLKKDVSIVLALASQ